MTVLGKILVVDHEMWMRDLLANYLTAEGHTVTLAARADEALAAVHRDPPDLVLLDIGLPGADGLEAIRRIRQAAPEVGVIILTGNGDVDLARIGLQLGAVDCLFKPAGLDRLASSVAINIGRARAAGALVAG